MSKKKEMSNSEKLQYASVVGVEITRQQLEDWLKRDIEGVYCLMAELLNSADVQCAIADVLWTRYQKLKATTNEIKPE